MGWKRIREHYRIEHAVHVRDGTILIGSAYVPDILTIEPDGTVRDGRLGHNGELIARYWHDLNADPETLRRLIAEPDDFERSIPVFTYRGATIIEKQCEALGWPNVTHDGEMMYENTFSPDRATAVRWAIENARSGVRLAECTVDDCEARLAKARARLADYRADVETLTALVAFEVPV